jgi:hypothetical protein
VVPPLLRYNPLVVLMRLQADARKHCSRLERALWATFLCGGFRRAATPPTHLQMPREVGFRVLILQEEQHRKVLRCDAS